MESRRAARRRRTLITVFMVCLFCFVLIVLYSGHDSWEEGSGGFVYKVGALVSGGVGLGALLLVALDAITARRQRGHHTVAQAKPNQAMRADEV
jgi:hypothetical protein